MYRGHKINITNQFKYLPLKNCSDILASSSRFWLNSQAGVSGMKNMATNKQAGNPAKMNARTSYWTKAPIM
jgi:hypothetical protein